MKIHTYSVFGCFHFFVGEEEERKSGRETQLLEKATTKSIGIPKYKQTYKRNN